MTKMKFFDLKKLKRTKNATAVIRAHWILIEREGVWICSNPECRAEFGDKHFSVEHPWFFCPRCGAKMNEKWYEHISK